MPKPLDYHAKLIIHDAARLTSSQKERIVSWLYAEAKDLREVGSEYAVTYTSRLMKRKPPK